MYVCSFSKVFTLPNKGGECQTVAILPYSVIDWILVLTSVISDLIVEFSFGTRPTVTGRKVIVPIDEATERKLPLDIVREISSFVPGKL